MDYETDLHEWVLPLVDVLPSGPHINFDGILGDVCLSDVYLNHRDFRLARRGRLDDLARQLVEREHWPPIFHPSIARRLDRRVLYEIIRSQFQAFAGHPNMISFTYMTMRTTRAITLFAFKLVSEKAESFFPFADNDYFDFAMSIPPEHKLDGKMHRRVLDQAYPELRGVPLPRRSTLATTTPMKSTTSGRSVNTCSRACVRYSGGAPGFSTAARLFPDYSGIWL